jgi:AraC-like DNA-binding protein
MEKALLDLTVRSYSTHHATHDHGFNQLVIPIEGSLLIEVDGHERRLVVGQTAVVAQGAPHTQASSVANRSLILDISPYRLDSNGAGRLLDKPFHALPAAAMKLVDYLVLTLNQRHLSPDNQQLWTALLLDAMTQPQHEPATRLVGVLHALEQNPGYPWTTQKMAEQASVSISHLHALFRQEMNTTPLQWLAALRLKQACTLLQRTALPIIEIADRCGYTDQSAFTRAFGRLYDQTPSTFRKLTEEAEHKKP